ncbi:MAG TPA: MarR family transcriptional regulator [Ktedonobacterales bacterium]|nr:MarR family transcriptional regulator [Ktedonobacterales bacterium]
MSSGSQRSEEQRATARKNLARAFRQFAGLSASFFRAAAARTGMTVTDVQVLDILAEGSPMTAGQLADLTGLTTGAITGMLNRLEKSGHVSRERDPEDGRRVLVRLAADANDMRELNATFASVAQGWDELTAGYDDEQIAFLQEFLKRSNALSQWEILRLREAPEDEQGMALASLGDLTSGHLVVASLSQVTVRAGAGLTTLYQARFEGSTPAVTSKDGVVTIRSPRLWGMLDWRTSTAEVALNPGIPWRISIQGGGSMIDAHLDGLDLTELEVTGGGSMLRLELPAPSGVVPVRISGGGSVISVQRPAGSAVRLHLKGRASAFVFDDQKFFDMGADVRLQSPGADTATQRYDIEVASSASMVTIMTA